MSFPPLVLAIAVGLAGCSSSTGGFAGCPPDPELVAPVDGGPRGSCKPGFGTFTVVIGEATCGRCLPQGSSTEGGACTMQNGCAEGMGCDGICRRTCTSATSCGPSQQCTGPRVGEFSTTCDPVPRFTLCGSGSALVIGRYEPASQRCVLVRLEASGAPSAGVTVPGGWGAAVAHAVFTDAGCPREVPDAGTVQALTLSGRIDFDAGVPSAAAVQLTMTFAADAGAVVLGSAEVRGCP